MTVLAHVENNQVTGVYDFLPDSWRNISNLSAFNINEDTDFLHALGWRTIQKAETPLFNEYTQQLNTPTYTYDPITDIVYETITVMDLPGSIQPQILPQTNIVDTMSEDHDTAMAVLRAKRDSLLYMSDHTQLSDVIAINGADLTAAFTTYRQQLRDLPTTYDSDPTFINEGSVVYPSKPGGK
jgi:hypothetical protein